MPEGRAGRGKISRNGESAQRAQRAVAICQPCSSTLQGSRSWRPPFGWWRRLKDKGLSRRGSFARLLSTRFHGSIHPAAEKRSSGAVSWPPYNTTPWDNAPLLDPSPSNVSTVFPNTSHPPTVPIFALFYPNRAFCRPPARDSTFASRSKS